VTAALLVLTGAGRFLFRINADRAHLQTGDARWIWARQELPEPAPVRFVASRELALSAISAGRAKARIFVDRRYVLRINGSFVGEGEQRPGDTLQAYDVSRFLIEGNNRLSIEASSPTGAGGILFWLDPGNGRPVVSDSHWEIRLSDIEVHSAIVWGRPPMYPWGYPALPGVQLSRMRSGQTLMTIDQDLKLALAPNFER
jgi:hypothetical protein